MQAGVSMPWDHIAGEYNVTKNVCQRLSRIPGLGSVSWGAKVCHAPGQLYRNNGLRYRVKKR